MKRIPRAVVEAARLVAGAGRAHFVRLTALQLATGAILGVQILVGKRVLDGVMGIAEDSVSPSTIVPELLLLIGVTVLSGALAALINHHQRFLSHLVGRHTFDKLIDVASAVPLTLYEDPEFHDRLARARVSGRQRPFDITNNLSSLVMAFITSGGIAVALVTMDPLLVPLVVAAGIPLLLATIYNSRQSYEFEFKWTPEARERGYLMSLFTSDSAAKEMRVFGTYSFLRRRYDALYEGRITEMKAFLGERLKVALVGTSAGALGIAIALASLVWFVISGRVDVATAVVAGAAMQLLYSRFSSIVRGVGGLVEAGLFLDDYQAFLAYAPGAAPASAQVVGEPRPREPRSEPFHGLEVEGVSFAYPKTDRLVLNDVSLAVHPGEVVALVGENGSGKTTLVKLMCALYQPQSGRVVWNGRDTRAIDPDRVRSGMTVLFQDFLRYHLTVRDNILLGRPENVTHPEDLEAAREAAIQAGAHEFVAGLPRGYRTRLGRAFEEGHELSVGQWQRLALARALFRGGEFLILDEPTAALDPRAESALFKHMRELWRGRSVLLISHRFSSVRMADRIYVMEKGRVTETGSHDELMKRSGLYSELFRLQARSYLGEELRGEPSEPDVPTGIS